MTTDLIAAVLHHPLATAGIVLLILGALVAIFGLSYRSSDSSVLFDPTHRGPYRPNPPSEDWRTTPTYLAHRAKRQETLRQAMRENFTETADLKDHAKESVAAHRQLTERRRLSLLAGQLRDRRN